MDNRCFLVELESLSRRSIRVSRFAYGRCHQFVAHSLRDRYDGSSPMVTRTLIGLLLAILILLALRYLERPLIYDHPEHVDTIVVLAGDASDQRYNLGLDLLRRGFATSMIVDGRSHIVQYGHTEADNIRQFIGESAGDLQSRIQVCPGNYNSTFDEADIVKHCLVPLHPRSVLLITDAYHTRRAKLIFSKRVPQFQYTAAAVKAANSYSHKWWRSREAAKGVLYGWEKMVWWLAVDRWRK